MSSWSFALGTFLHRLPTPARDRLLAVGTIHRYPAGHVLIRQGDAAGAVFILLRSAVKVVARAENGAETLLAVRVSGDLVGEMAVLGAGRRSATVTTCGETVACVIKGPIFVAFLSATPPPEWRSAR